MKATPSNVDSRLFKSRSLDVGLNNNKETNFYKFKKIFLKKLDVIIHGYEIKYMHASRRLLIFNFLNSGPGQFFGHKGLTV